MPHSGVARRIVKADLALFRAVTRMEPPLLDRGLPLLSRSANHSLLWIAMAGGLATWGGRYGKRAAVRGIGSIALTSSIVSGVLKNLFRRPRPLLHDVPLARQLTRQPRTTSFPSGHAASACAFAVGVSSEVPVLGPPIGLLAATVACSRVYTGAHYPVDVLVGGALGSGIALLTRLAWPTVPGEVKKGVGRAEPRRLAPNDDGSGLAVVVNLDAGPTFRGAPLDRIREQLPHARIVERREGEDLHAILERVVEEAEALGICGGDGSVNAAAEVALAHERPLLVIPGGTLNHLARDLGIRSPDDAVDAFTGGEAVSVDLAAIDGRPFLNSASFGAYTDMVDHRRTLEARLGRWPGHLLGAAKAAFTARPIELTLDGRPRQVWMVYIGNCRHRPASFPPSWRERLDDGVLDVRVVDGSPPLSRIRLVASALIGRLTNSLAYEQWEARELRVESDGAALRLGRDGQTFDGDPSFTVEKRPEKLVVYAPHE